MDDIATVGGAGIGGADTEDAGEAMDSAAGGFGGAISGGGKAGRAGTLTSEPLSDSAIRNYCTWARRELIEQVEARMRKYGIAEEGAPAPDADTVGNLVLSPQERTQRARLLGLLRQQPGAGPAERAAALADRAAYTWFNCIIAIRFMEVHDYLPWHTCVFCSADADGANKFEPQIIKEALDVELPGVDSEEVVRLVQSGEDEPLFRYLFLAACNRLAECLPAVFEPVGAAFELLLPSGLLRKEGVIGQLLEKLAYSEHSSRGEGERPSHQGDWLSREGNQLSYGGDQLSRADNQPSSEDEEESGGITWDKVEILGWMYQYYNSEVKDDFFKSKRKATARDIAPATQLFTPEWIVRYMVENSLGRLWMLNFPESGLSRGWKYYIKPDEQHEDFIRISGPEDIRLCDPACGSGHILVYAFSLLFDMYAWSGYREREIPQLILEKNLTGFEIDPRAAQIANLALTMCARKHDRRFFERGVHPNVHVVAPVRFDRDGEGNVTELPEDAAVMSDPQLLDALEHLDEIGSLFQPTEPQIAALRADVDRFTREAKTGDLFKTKTAEKLQTALKTCESLAKTYDCVIANPPYMGSSSFSPFMSKWIKKNYPDVKSDLCTCFIERIAAMSKKSGLAGITTSNSWMFLSSFETLRRRIVNELTIETLIQLSVHGFHGIAAQVCTFVLRNSYSDGYLGAYIRLNDFDHHSLQAPKVREAIAHQEDCPYLYHRNAQVFTRIPGLPIAYWIGDGLVSAFSSGSTFESVAHPKVGMQTSNNDKYLRLWWEGDFRPEDTSKKWIKYLKGGSYRKWYGNLEWVLLYKDNPDWIRAQPNARVLGERYLSLPKNTWTDLTSGRNSFRFAPCDTFYDISGHCYFPNTEGQMQLLSYSNSTVFEVALKLFNSTMHCQVGDVAKVPYLPLGVSSNENIGAIGRLQVALSKLDWDSFETSWDFKRHPLA